MTGRPLTTLGLVVSALVASALVADLVGAALAAGQLELLGRMADGDWTIEEADANDARLAWLGGVRTFANLVAGLAALGWCYRAYANLAARGHDRESGSSWAVAAWLVPIVSFFAPYGIVRELWAKSGVPPTEAPRSGPWFLPWWWGAWVASQLGGSLARVAEQGQDLETAQLATALWIAIHVAHAAAGVAFIVLVRTISERQDGADSPTTF